jgi:hypothetical protein
MVSEILIEGSRLDLFEDLGAELNYAIDDIKDFSSRNTNYSKTITLPGNANNNKIFGHIYNFSSANNYYVSDPNSPNVSYNFDPSKQASCKIFVNKIQVFKGVLRLLEIKINNGTIEYECAVFGELGGFASAIGNSLLEDLDTFNGYNQNWSATNIVNSWTAAGVASGKGIVYPLIDYGKCKHGGSSKDYHINAFRPAFFVKEMMDGIIGNSGYTYESAFLETPFFKSLIIPNNKADLELLRKDLLEVYNSSIITTNAEYIQFGTLSNLTLFSTTNNQEFTFTGTTGTLGKFRVLSQPYLTEAGTFTIAVYQNATELYSETFEPSIPNQIYEIDWLIDAVLNNNDVIKIQVTYDAVQEYQSVITNMIFSFVSDYPVTVKATLDGMLQMKNLIPKGIQQKDFFAAICRMFNLYVFEDVDKTKHLLIEPYIDFYRTGAGFLKLNDLGELLLHGQVGDNTGLLLLSDPVADSIDWSNKVDYSQEISLKPMSELNSRYYDFVYTQDSDYYNDTYFKKYNETYADRKEDTKFQFAEDRTEIKLLFSPSVLVSRSGDDKLCASIFKVENEEEVSMDAKMRIMQFAYITGKSNWHIKGVSPSNSNISSTLNSYGYGGHLDNPEIPTSDINFGVPNQVYFTLTNPFPSANLFTAFWGDYLAEITSKDSKLLTCYLYLNIVDIYSLDFAQLIYIDGALWRLNKIIDFNPTIPQTTRVELLRVIELTYE